MPLESNPTSTTMFLCYSIELFIRPHLAFRALLNEPRRVAYGISGNLLLALVYFIGITIAHQMNVMHLTQLYLPSPTIIRVQTAT
jgi:hypothetical protein